ncbi:fimbrial protein [Pseudomonas asiatica]|uniref:fimbrial protein n=1 Tax=Pseudomonas asiatica TaxID=2219225 RepID=UPI0018AB540B|nr:fimbrial protein [Pseudomonas asiatica]MBF8803884.1 type 1 fimbrial protein [Pseudomonas asiatica]WJM55067.1 fimbrial protein [Pseudomonas asiatica]
MYTHFYYDAVRRKVRETVAPGTSFEASCTYDYHLSVEASQPTQVTTNVQKVVSTLLLDGLNRSVGEKREIDTANDPDNPVRKTFTVATKQYDSLGRQCAETVHDNLDNNESLALTSRFEYDDWGNLSKTIGPNGVIYCQQRSPFGKDGDIIETWQERADEAALKQPLRRQLQKVEFNRFGKPVYEQRIDLDGQEVGRRDYLYEGLGRCVTETRTQRDPLSTPAEPKPALRHAWKFSYDVWGRMMRNERPDQSALIRRFSDFTSETLTTRLELEGDATPICTRTFDGLGRMSTLTVGPRIERYDYQEGRTLVHQHPPTLTANVNNTQPLFTGSLPPINGEDLTGRVIQTGVDGIGIHVRLVAPYHGKGGSPSNAWTYINWTSVPWQGYADHDPGPTGIQLNNLRAYITLIKTGPIAPGPHSFNGIQLFSGTYSDVGTVMRAHLHGTVTTAQCTLKANAVSPAPVDLGTHDVKDFGKPDDFTKAVPFRITLNDCESDASGGTQAYIRLDGANGSKPIDVDKGVFSLSSGSGATGIGIQVLHADGSPFRLEEEVAVMPLSPGDLTLNFQARYYQTAPTVTPGEANGALNFTVTYR